MEKDRAKQDQAHQSSLLPRRLTPVKTLPQSFRPRGTFGVSQNSGKALVILNIIGAIMFFVYGWLFLKIAIPLRPELADEILRIPHNMLRFTVLCVVATVVMITLHELTHGLFLWLFTREQPRLGFRLFYAYAAAPDWYIPRGQYFVVALSPLALLTLVGFLLLWQLPIWIVPPLLFGMLMNAGGSVGDIAVILWLIAKPSGALIRDIGDSISIYGLPPAEKPGS